MHNWDKQKTPLTEYYYSVKDEYNFSKI